MKIKTLKIKVETENQDFDFSEFLTGSNTIYKTEATLKKEKGGFYWHVFITYEPKNNFVYIHPRDARELPEGFESEVLDFLYANLPNKIRVKHAIIGGLKRLLSIEDLEGFKFLKQIGNSSIEHDKEFFTALLEIIKKYQIPKE